MRVLGKQTIGFDVWGGFATINYSNGVKSAGVPGTYTTLWPIGSYSVVVLKPRSKATSHWTVPAGILSRPSDWSGQIAERYLRQSRRC